MKTAKLVLTVESLRELLTPQKNLERYYRIMEGLPPDAEIFNMQVAYDPNIDSRPYLEILFESEGHESGFDEVHLTLHHYYISESEQERRTHYVDVLNAFTRLMRNTLLVSQGSIMPKEKDLRMIHDAAVSVLGGRGIEILEDLILPEKETGADPSSEA